LVIGSWQLVVVIRLELHKSLMRAGQPQM